ncbi:diguanylate cyclase domain-containing protein [Hansschlegelia sp. KR7-227]|uniref:diguanylate cyclase domain-containing protein n=1 Tax=Hansschlegelia sp. KR7-227 TaxID=3400914 RepID=UPI003C06FEB9
MPDDIRRALIASLFGTLPIFAGGVVNSIMVAAIIAGRMATPVFLGWLAVEVAICALRLVVLLTCFRNAARGRPTPTDVYLLLGVCWAGSVGFGAFISLLSGDWVIATLACMSAAAMVGGVCFRNFGAPRLAAAMIVLSLGPTCLAAPFTGEWIMVATFVQIPFYLVSMRMAAYKLNGLLVTTMRAQAENQHLARHDALTGLPNRVGLMHAIEERADRRVALLYLDLDGFKAVNDGHGHAAGDRLLTCAADRLRTLLRSGDFAARIGGDEFVVVARGVDRRQASSFGERLIQEIGQPYDLGQGLVVRVGVSVGVALAPDHGEDVPDLLDVADTALYLAKTAGKSRCVVAEAPAQAAGVV